MIGDNTWILSKKIAISGKENEKIKIRYMDSLRFTVKKPQNLSQYLLNESKVSFCVEPFWPHNWFDKSFPPTL